MTWYALVAIYLIVWWLVLFAVLPFGVRRDESPETGHDPGAPQRPMLLRKFAATTVIASVICGALYWAYESGLLSLR
ncbi:MAG: DUF1467 family protein [Alphaproteobacteria bacterium]|nr:DUF1467 family protein [Alphaproteobacteria bacterium]